MPLPSNTFRITNPMMQLTYNPDREESGDLAGLYLFTLITCVQMHKGYELVSAPPEMTEFTPVANVFEMQFKFVESPNQSELSSLSYSHFYTFVNSFYADASQHNPTNIVAVIQNNSEARSSTQWTTKRGKMLLQDAEAGRNMLY